MKADMELIHEVRSGQRASFSELVLRHQRALLRLTLRFTRDPNQAEDIVQESFIKAYEKLHLFEGRASFKSWLFQIALNTARNKLRGRWREEYSMEEVEMGVHAGAEANLIHGDIRTMIRNEVDKLPEKQRLALTLRIYEDLSFKEIADIMQCPYDTAKANYRHALLKLRERLEEVDGLQDLSVFEQSMPAELRSAAVEVEQ